MCWSRCPDFKRMRLAERQVPSKIYLRSHLSSGHPMIFMYCAFLSWHHLWGKGLQFITTHPTPPPPPTLAFFLSYTRSHSLYLSWYHQVPRPPPPSSVSPSPSTKVWTGTSGPSTTSTSCPTWCQIQTPTSNLEWTCGAGGKPMTQR